MMLLDKADTLLDLYASIYPELPDILNRANLIAQGSHNKRVYPYQSVWLYHLCKQTPPVANMLELGTYYGYTTAIMALSSPDARITTLEPGLGYPDAVRNLAGLKNVECLCVKSMDYLGLYSWIMPSGVFDLIFVDGDHNKIERDLHWWNLLKTGGMIVFHDYSPAGSGRPCPIVFETLNRFATWLRVPDELIQDENGVGMVAWIKHHDDPEYHGEIDG